MWNLPQEHDRKQRPSSGVEVAASGFPADHGRKRSRNCPDNAAQGGFLLEWGVNKEIGDDDGRSDERAKSVDREPEHQQATKSERGAKDQSLYRLNPPFRQRPVARPLHRRIGIPFQKLIESERSASG